MKRKYKLKSSFLRKKTYGYFSPGFKSNKSVPASGSGSSGSSTRRVWKDPLGLDRPDPWDSYLYELVEAKDGNLYMNTGDLWVIPGQSNWNDARKYYGDDYNYISKGSGWRYSRPKSYLHPLDPKDEL